MSTKGPDLGGNAQELRDQTPHNLHLVMRLGCDAKEVINQPPHDLPAMVQQLTLDDALPKEVPQEQPQAPQGRQPVSQSARPALPHVPQQQLQAPGRQPVPQNARQLAPPNVPQQQPQAPQERQPVPQSARQPVPQSARQPVPQSARQPVPQSARQPAPSNVPRQRPQVPQAHVQNPQADAYAQQVAQAPARIQAQRAQRDHPIVPYLNLYRVRQVTQQQPQVPQARVQNPQAAYAQHIKAQALARRKAQHAQQGHHPDHGRPNRKMR